VSYPGYRFLIALISTLILAGIWLFLYRTNYGILIRASMQDRDMANAMGINVNLILVTTFVSRRSPGRGWRGAGRAHLPGVISHGNDVILVCFIVVIIGGLGSLEGTLVAALGICALEGCWRTFFLPPAPGRRFLSSW